MHNDSNSANYGHPSGGHSFGMVQVSIARDRTLPALVKQIYTVLATYADAHTRIAWPSQATIAADATLSERAVRKGLRLGEELGVWSWTRTQTSNRYQLHDLAVGGYIPGSGPVEIPPGTTCRLDRHDMPPGAAPGAAEQDHATRPQSQTIDSSGDTSVGVTAQARRPRIHLPRGFADLDDGQAFRYLVGAGVSALWAAGMTPVDDAGDRLGRALKVSVQEGMDRDRLVAALEGTLALAGTDSATWGSLASWPAAA